MGHKIFVHILFVKRCFMVKSDDGDLYTPPPRGAANTWKQETNLGFITCEHRKSAYNSGLILYAILYIIQAYFSLQKNRTQIPNSERYQRA